jgi:hypothetical protein
LALVLANLLRTVTSRPSMIRPIPRQIIKKH